MSLWLDKLQLFGFILKDPEALAEVMSWRAHMETHRLEDEMKQMRAALQPTLPAAGTPATAAGNQPTAGAPPSTGPTLPQPGTMSTPPAVMH